VLNLSVADCYLHLRKLCYRSCFQRLKCGRNHLAAGPTGGAHGAPPDPLAGFRERGGKGKKRRGIGRVEKGGEGRERELLGKEFKEREAEKGRRGRGRGGGMKGKGNFSKPPPPPVLQKLNTPLMVTAVYVDQTIKCRETSIANCLGYATGRIEIRRQLHVCCHL
jgi:hypothetical protein